MVGVILSFYLADSVTVAADGKPLGSPGDSDDAVKYYPAAVPEHARHQGSDADHRVDGDRDESSGRAGS